MVSVAELFVQIVGENLFLQAFVGGVVIAGLNLFGALLVFIWRNPSKRSLDGALGFAAGVMLAAAFTSLIIPGIYQYSNGNPIPTLIGIIVGVIFLDRADFLIPHAHYLLTGRIRKDQSKSTSLPVDDEKLVPVILFILAITLHNMPEGLAVGVGFGSGNINNAIVLMFAIGIQNIPEGLAVSVAAINAGLDRRSYAVFAGIRSGVVEIPLAVLGAVAVSTIEPLLPYAMGFAAGAMIFVISDEIIPETHIQGNERIATLGLMAGVIIMLYLDVSLG